MNAGVLSDFTYVELNHSKPKTLFLLHGTGGDEHDLIPLVEPMQEEFHIVGLRGNVLENGMPRFFARKAMGVFDMENLAQETDKLASFLRAWYAAHEMQASDAAFVGFSNGANMILATLFRHPEVIQAAALLHAMLPFEPPDVDLASKRFLVTHGLADRIIPAGEAERIAAALELRGAQVEIFAHGGGHELPQEERQTLSDFIRRQ